VTSAALTALAVLVLDQLTKLWALQGLAPSRPVPVIDSFFSLTLVMNPGLAFGMLSSTPAGWRWLVALLSIGALAVLGVVGLRMLPGGGRLTPLALGFILGGAVGIIGNVVAGRLGDRIGRRVLIIGGALGNMIDRLAAGRVVDFIHVHWGAHYFPAFNVADSAITIGAVLLLLDAWQESRSARRPRS